MKGLSQPEQGVYLVGMKPYGRAPTFLALTGCEQVCAVAALADDHEAAERVELVLPETGGLFDQPGTDQATEDGCCAPATAPQPVQLGTTAAAPTANEQSTGGCCGPWPTSTPADGAVTGAGGRSPSAHHGLCTFIRMRPSAFVYPGTWWSVPGWMPGVTEG